MNKTITQIYKKFMDEYGPQGWWPVYSLRNAKERDDRGYFIKNVSKETDNNLLLDKSSRFEITIGAILTQNTAWTNVEKALANLIEIDLVDPNKIIEINQGDLAEYIRSSGYYNQKAKKIKILTHFLQEGDYFTDGNIPKRNDLLALWGIGEETADSILLYAYNFPVFVIDAYTKRIFTRLGLLGGNEKYSEIAAVFTDSLKKDAEVFQEYHALIVRHAKEHCRKKPDCDGCGLNTICLQFSISQR